MANERVSQLQDLLASATEPNDLLLVTDVSQKESKRMEIGQLLDYIQSSGSFFAYHATTADTAAYVKSTNVDGIVAEATLSTQSLSSSVSDYAISSSYSLHSDTASYTIFSSVNVANADTASFLQYSGAPNGTASYAILSNASNVATVASNLLYSGVPNGTSSYSISASAVINCSHSTTASYSNVTSMAVTSSYSIVSDNTVQSISSSYADQAAHADTASYISNTFYGPKFITPITIVSTTAAVPWTKYNCPVQHIPIGTRAVIVDASAANGGVNVSSWVQTSPDSSSVVSGIYYFVIGFQTGGGGDACNFAGQAATPCTSSTANSSSFYYKIGPWGSDGGCLVRLIGYY